MLNQNKVGRHSWAGNRDFSQLGSNRKSSQGPTKTRKDHWVHLNHMDQQGDFVYPRLISHSNYLLFLLKNQDFSCKLWLSWTDGIIEIKIKSLRPSWWKEKGFKISTYNWLSYSIWTRKNIIQIQRNIIYELQQAWR